LIARPQVAAEKKRKRLSPEQAAQADENEAAALGGRRAKLIRRETPASVEAYNFEHSKRRQERADAEKRQKNQGRSP
jgi:hypothetical protein